MINVRECVCNRIKAPVNEIVTVCVSARNVSVRVNVKCVVGVRSSVYQQQQDCDKEIFDVVDRVIKVTT